jgi:hypothetical protein
VELFNAHGLVRIVRPCINAVRKRDAAQQRQLHFRALSVPFQAYPTELANQFDELVRGFLLCRNVEMILLSEKRFHRRCYPLYL